MRPKKRKIIVKEISVEELIPDDKNFNTGSMEGAEMLDNSFSKLGAGRSVLIDKNNRNIAGNKSVEAFMRNGGKKVIIVETDRNTLVAVKRPDLDLDSAEGREMALADNQTQAVNYVADEELIAEVAQSYDINTETWGIENSDDSQPKKIKQEDLRPFIKTHVLLSFPPEVMIDIEPHLESIRKVKGVEYEQGSN